MPYLFHVSGPVGNGARLLANILDSGRCPVLEIKAVVSCDKMSSVSSLSIVYLSEYI